MVEERRCVGSCWGNRRENETTGET